MDEAKELLSICKEYHIALRCELKRKELREDDVARAAELAAYFTHCSLQPVHTALSLRSAMSIFFKLKNYATCAHFCRRLLELNPGQKVRGGGRLGLRGGCCGGQGAARGRLCWWRCGGWREACPGLQRCQLPASEVRCAASTLPLSMPLRPLPPADRAAGAAGACGVREDAHRQRAGACGALPAAARWPALRAPPTRRPRPSTLRTARPGRPPHTAPRALLPRPSTSPPHHPALLTTPPPLHTLCPAQVNYDPRNPFDICSLTFTPIYRGSKYAEDPYTGARFQTSCAGQLSPLGEFVKIGADASGLLISPTQSR